LSSEFWMGILLSIPIGVGTGLSVAPIQRWLDSYGRHRSLSRTKRMRADYEEAHYFFTYHHRLTHYFLNRAIEILRQIMFVGIGFGYWMLVRPTPPLTGWAHFSQWLITVGLVFSIVSLSQEVNRLHAIYYRAEFFGQYREKVLKVLPDLDKTPFATTQPPDFI
jgi:hypothetical protein